MSARFLSAQEFAALELLIDSGSLFMQKAIFGTQHFQRTGNDIVRVPVSACLHSLAD